jgi:uncharacterized protein YkwD
MSIKHTNSPHNPADNRRPLHLLLMVLPVLLTACGGGGSSETTPTQSTAPLPTPAAVATPAAATSAPAAVAAPAPVDNASCGLNAPGGIQAEILQRVNALRASGAVCGSVAYRAAGALNWNTTLLQAAKGHATDMATNNYFAHTGLDGRSPAQRVAAAGYNYSRMGENIAAGQPSVASVMAAWIASPGHCQNMMTPEYLDIAVACVRNDASTYRLYWAMELGRLR